MKKQKLKKLLKIGILIFGISIFLWNCGKNEDIMHSQESESSQDHTVKKMSLNDLIKSSAFGAFEKKVSERKSNNLEAKNNSVGLQYEYIGNEVLSSHLNGQTIYTVAIRDVNDKNGNYDLNLLIKENSSGVSTYIVKYSKFDKSVIIHPVNTNQNNKASKSYISKNQTVCRTYSWEVTVPCSCEGHTSGPCCCGTCTPGTPYSSSSGSSVVCWDEPEIISELPGGGSGGSNSGTGFGDPSGIPSTDDIYNPVYIYEGEEECDGNGNCTPPLYWAQAEASGGSPSGRELLQILNVITIDSDGLTNAQRQWVENTANFREVDLLLNFLNQNNNSTEAKAFAKWSIDIGLLPNTPCGIGHDCLKSIRVMANGLRKFHGEDGKLMADYFENIIDDPNAFETMGDLQDFYDKAVQITKNANANMRKAIVFGFVDGVKPIVELALYEVGGTLALKILNKLPVKYVTTPIKNVITRLTASSSQAFSKLKHAKKYGISSYKGLKGIFTELGITAKAEGVEFHHLFEQRFVTQLEGKLGRNTDDWLSIVVDKGKVGSEHYNFTQAWKNAIGYEGQAAGWTKKTTNTATIDDIYRAARDIYKDYPEILKALGL